MFSVRTYADALAEAASAPDAPRLQNADVCERDVASAIDAVLASPEAASTNVATRTWSAVGRAISALRMAHADMPVHAAWSRLRQAYARILVHARHSVAMREHIAHLVIEGHTRAHVRRGASPEFVQWTHLQKLIKLDRRTSWLACLLIGIDLRADDVIACRVDGPDTLGPLRDVLGGDAPPLAYWAQPIFQMMSSHHSTDGEDGDASSEASLRHQAKVHRACYVLSLRPLFAPGDELAGWASDRGHYVRTLAERQMTHDAMDHQHVAHATYNAYDQTNHLLLALLLVERREEALPCACTCAGGLTWRTRMPSGTMLTEALMGSVGSTVSAPMPPHRLAHFEALASVRSRAFACLLRHPLLLAALPTTYSVFNSTIANVLTARIYRGSTDRAGHAYDYDANEFSAITCKGEAACDHGRLLSMLLLPPWSPSGAPRCTWSDVACLCRARSSAYPMRQTHAAAHSRARYFCIPATARAKANSMYTMQFNPVPRTPAHVLLTRLLAASLESWLIFTPWTPTWVHDILTHMHAHDAFSSTTVDACMDHVLARMRASPEEPLPICTEALHALRGIIAFEFEIGRDASAELKSAYYDIGLRIDSYVGEIVQLVREEPTLDASQLVVRSVHTWSTSDMYRYVHSGALAALRAAHATVRASPTRTHAHAMTDVACVVHAVAATHAHAGASDARMHAAADDTMIAAS